MTKKFDSTFDSTFNSVVNSKFDSVFDSAANSTSTPVETVVPKKLDLICSNPEKRHVEFDVYFKSMDDEFTTCPIEVEGHICGAVRQQYFGGRRSVPDVSGLTFHESHEGIGGKLEFHSVKEMDAHLDYVRQRQHNPDLDYVFPTAAQRRQMREFHNERYWERQKSRGWGEAEINRQREARLEKMANGGR